jgi:hypothetical protein
MFKALLALSALFLIVSCQTMSPEACQVADWRALGVVDGEAGASLSKFEARQSDCAKIGVKADFAAYDSGRLSGLRNFCQPGSGFRAGLSGYTYAGACPADLEDSFLLGYRDGAAAYQVKQALSSAESEVSSARSARDDLADKLLFFRSQLSDSKSGEQDKTYARQRIDDLERDLRSARDRIRDAEAARDRAGYNLDRAHLDIGMRWGAW